MCSGFNPMNLLLAHLKNTLLDHFSNRFCRRLTHEKWMFLEHEIDCKFFCSLCHCPSLPFLRFSGVHEFLLSCVCCFLLHILSTLIFLPSRYGADGFYYSFPFIRYIEPDFTPNTSAEQRERNTGP